MGWLHGLVIPICAPKFWGDLPKTWVDLPKFWGNGFPTSGKSFKSVPKFWEDSLVSEELFKGLPKFWGCASSVLPKSWEVAFFAGRCAG